MTKGTSTVTHEVLREQGSFEGLDPAEISAQLSRIIGSPGFVDSPRLQQFLIYVVEESLAGRAGRIKGYSIAHDVFHREDPEDTQLSAIVRVEAGRLRRRLADYYAAEGQADVIRISIPKGAYVPRFQTIAPDVRERVRPFEPPPQRGSGRVKVTTGLTALVALLVMGGVWLGLQVPDAVEQTEFLLSESIDERPFIVVLPFQQITTGVAGERLASGLAEDIVTDLVRLSAIDVVALPTARQFAGKPVNVEQLRETLQVTHILMGSVRGNSDNVRVSARLIDTRTGKEIWAERFDRKPTDTLHLQDEIASRVVEGMAVRLASGDRVRSSQSDDASAEALSLYKTAMDLGNPPSDPGRNAVALKSFERVMQMEPGFAGGFAGAAYIHSFTALFGHSTNPQSSVRQAIELAETAIDLSPDFGMSYTALAMAYLVQRDFDQTLKYSTKAVQAQPNDPYIMTYHAVILAFNGQAEKGISYAQRAVRLDPLNARTPFLNILATVYFHAGKYQLALDALKRNLQRAGPDSPGSRITAAAAYFHLGENLQAWKEFDQIQNFPMAKSATMDWVRRTRRLDADVELLEHPLRQYADWQTTR